MRENLSGFLIFFFFFWPFYLALRHPTQKFPAEWIIHYPCVKLNFGRILKNRNQMERRKKKKSEWVSNHFSMKRSRISSLMGGSLHVSSSVTVTLLTLVFEEHKKHWCSSLFSHLKPISFFFLQPKSRFVPLISVNLHPCTRHIYEFGHA